VDVLASVPMNLPTADLPPHEHFEARLAVEERWTPLAFLLILGIWRFDRRRERGQRSRVTADLCSCAICGPIPGYALVDREGKT
jgi:hypothetical protein